MTDHEPEASPAETPEMTAKTPPPAGRQGDSTTMRFQGVGAGHEAVELDARGLSAEDQATIDAAGRSPIGPLCIRTVTLRARRAVVLL